MAWMHPLAVEHRRKLYTRHDAWRLAPPGTPEAKMPGWLDPSATRVRWKEAQEEEARRQEEGARAAFEAQFAELRASHERVKAELAEINYELAWRRILRKFRPDQPRVPAGSPQGGQWTSGDGGGGGAGADIGTDTDANTELEQDQGTPLSTARDQTSRDDLPQLEALTNDARIRPRIDEAWAASNPNSTRPQENGFWISRNEATGELFTRPFASRGFADSIQPVPTPDDAIAFFHTHPNRPDAGYDPGPSSADALLAARRDLPGLIQSHVGMYYFGPPLRPVRLR